MKLSGKTLSVLIVLAVWFGALVLAAFIIPPIHNWLTSVWPLFRNFDNAIGRMLFIGWGATLLVCLITAAKDPES